MKKLEVFNEIILSSQAVEDNIKFLRRLGGADVIPVLKSNAYGHGIRQIAQVLQKLSTEIVAVDGYYEALQIRHIFKREILVLGAIRRDNIRWLKNRRFSFVLQSIDDLEAFGQSRRKFNIHLEVNTGMNRMGIRPSEVTECLQALKNYKNLHLEGVMTHLASVDEPDNDSPEQQVKIFDEVVEKILAAGYQPKIIHVANSAGIGRVKSRFANYSRPGIAVYGINELSKSDKRFKQFEKLKPVLQLRSTIVKVVNLKRGEAVGYGGSFMAPKAMRIGVLPLGYYEGVARTLSNRGVVITLSGRELAMVGRVCMNHTMIDLSGTELGEGDKVVIISSNPAAGNSVMGLQREFGLFSYETLARLSENIRRVVK